MRILFLTNNQNTQPLIDWLKNSAKEEVIVWHERLMRKHLEELQPDLIISYNYKFLVKEEILDMLPNRVINLHISLLPYNRGSNPNVWSFLEDTPKGVTIHLMNEGLDTGAILLQKKVYFEEDKETLSSTYKKLHSEIQRLFIENWGRIKDFKIKPLPQTNIGSTHYLKDFEKIKFILENDGWNITIRELKKKYRLLQETFNGNKNFN